MTMIPNAAGEPQIDTADVERHMFAAATEKDEEQVALDVANAIRAGITDKDAIDLILLLADSHRERGLIEEAMRPTPEERAARTAKNKAFAEAAFDEAEAL